MHGDDLLFTFANQGFLVVGNDHVVNADGETCTGGEPEPERLHFVQHFDCRFQLEAQIAVVHQLTNALFLQQSIDERHALGEVIVQDRASDGGIDVLPFELHWIGMSDVLIVVSVGQVYHFAGIAQADGSKSFDRSCIERQQNFFGRRKCAALTLCARLGLGQVIKTKNHVLRRDGNRMS